MLVSKAEHTVLDQAGVPVTHRTGAVRPSPRGDPEATPDRVWRSHETKPADREQGTILVIAENSGMLIRPTVPEKSAEHMPRILIVDDDSAVRSLFDHALAEDGYLVTAVGTYAQAVAAARNSTFDAIVTDLSLLDIDGIDAIRNFRSDFPWTEILAVSGYMAGCVPDVVLAAGAAACLAKPATPRELREAVHRLLDPGGRWQTMILNRRGFRVVSKDDGALPGCRLHSARLRARTGRAPFAPVAAAGGTITPARGLLNRDAAQRRQPKVRPPRRRE